MMKLLIFLVYLLTGTVSYANVIENQDALTPVMINDWYSGVGLEGYVSKDVFETAVRGALYYSKESPSKVNTANQFIIVNYQNDRSSKHFFWVQIRPSLKMVFSSTATYGVAGEPLEAKRCIHNGNIPHPPNYDSGGGTHRSPRGFLYTGGTHDSASFPNSVKVGGLENGPEYDNTNTLGRKILIHPGWVPGHTAGCIGLDRRLGEQTEEVIRELKSKKIVIYTSDGSSHGNYPFTRGRMKFTAEDISRISGSDTTIESSAPAISAASLRSFLGVGSTSGDFNLGGGGMGYLLGGGGLLSIAALTKMDDKKDEEETDDTFNKEMTMPGARQGQAALHGTASFEECQNRASAPWSQVVAEASKESGDPSKYFKATYIKIEDEAGGNYFGPTDAVVANMAKDNYASNERCIALARMTKDSDFDKDNINTPETYSAKDKAINCKYDGPESQDYTKCKELVDTYDESLENEVVMNEDQSKSFSQLADSGLTDSKSGGNIQADLPQLQKTLIAEKDKIAGERSEFQTAKLNSLNAMQAAMPNRNSILRDCQSYMVGRSRGKADYTAFVSTLIGAKDKTLPSTPDPCLSVSKISGVNLVQNIPARRQAIVAIEKVGLKALSLDSKQRVFMNRSGSLNSSALKDQDSKGYAAKFKPGKNQGKVNKFGFSGDVNYKNEGCIGNECKYKGGYGLKGQRKAKRSGQSLGANYLAAYSPANLNSQSARTSSKVLTFDSGKKKRGVYDDSFYQNIDLALAGKIPLSSLSEGQLKEYNALLDYRKINSESKKRRKQFLEAKDKEAKGRTGTGREIWFDKKMDLFKIISNRYKAVIKDNKL